MATTNLGRITVVPKGAYSAGTYKRLDVVSYNNGSYMSMVGANTALPSDDTKWMLMSAPGGGGDVTQTGTQTLTNKTLEAVVLTNGFTEEVYTLTGTTPSLSSANGSIQTWTLTANSTPTDGLSSGQSIILGIDDGSAYTITWPSVVWTKSGGSGTAPTLNATVRTWVVIWKVSSTLYGSYLGDA